MQTLKKNYMKHGTVALGRLVQNIVGSRYLVMEPLNYVSFTEDSNSGNILGLTLYLASSLLGTVGTLAKA